MEKQVDKAYWSKRKEYEKDALYITYYNMGPITIEKRKPNNMLEHGGRYEPEPGIGKAAGDNHLYNAEKIGKIFGNHHYGVKYPSPPRSSVRIAPPPAPTTDPVVPPTPPHPNASPASTVRRSADFIQIQNRYNVTLKPGGTLSDIVAVQNAAGNPLTLSDLRAINGLHSRDDQRIQPDVSLLIPEKIDGYLVVDDGVAGLQFDPFDGTYGLSIRLFDGRRYGYERRYHRANEEYTDHYSVINSMGLMQQGKNQVNTVQASRFTHNHALPFWETAEFPYSTAVARIGYKASSATLMIQFTSGGVYHYQNVPRSVYEDFIQIRNKGRFFHQAIKGTYTHERMDKRARSPRSVSVVEGVSEPPVNATRYIAKHVVEDFMLRKDQPSEAMLNDKMRKQAAQLIHALASYTPSGDHAFSSAYAANEFLLNGAHIHLGVVNGH